MPRPFAGASASQLLAAFTRDDQHADADAQDMRDGMENFEIDVSLTTFEVIKQRLRQSRTLGDVGDCHASGLPCTHHGSSKFREVVLSSMVRCRLRRFLRHPHDDAL
ncbi:hypothetical protein AMIS_67160 [Actinoplanes missouriensis 431]|uniref:Uncharacterized protein n=1 Tax=Actinoplanes missouriensis (strain ATCC 14538 / DSM 43046 / CBS 188.64 / JCM 3121 / NBRC 102363 / NCIMB 12654 / NRRL B-3342 / UNCC 431) TaxID=512565 RepID=I0HFZ9_ACTM4|nr:hypothetical protein AMIS_67160 [Actinoplanes missouriensis 431]